MAPIIAKSPAEQSEFYSRFDSWRMPAHEDITCPAEPDAADGPAMQVKTRDPFFWAIGGALAVIAASVLVFAFFFRIGSSANSRPDRGRRCNSPRPPAA